MLLQTVLLVLWQLKISNQIMLHPLIRIWRPPISNISLLMLISCLLNQHAHNLWVAHRMT